MARISEVRPIRRINIYPNRRSSVDVYLASELRQEINRRGPGYLTRPRLRPQLNHRCSQWLAKKANKWKWIVNRRSGKNRILLDVDTPKSRRSNQLDSMALKPPAPAFYSLFKKRYFRLAFLPICLSPNFMPYSEFCFFAIR